MFLKFQLNFWLIKVYKKYILKSYINENSYSYIYINPLKIYLISFFFKKNFFYKFNCLSDITAVDCIWKFKRFELYYNFLNLYMSYRIFICCNLLINSKNPYTEGIISISRLYNSANWLEREIWDLFGIFFKNHFDLRRILTDYGFVGFPLRKDFPLSGYVEIYYNDIMKLITISKLQLIQNFRIFEFINPWF